MGSLDTFRNLFPEFSAVPDARVTSWLSVCATQLNATAFGLLYEQAAVFMAAHYLQLSLEREAASAGAGLGPGAQVVGPITSLTTDRLSMSTGGLSSRKSIKDDFFSQTQYGLSYLALCMKVATTPIVINGNYTSQIFSNTST